MIAIIVIVDDDDAVRDSTRSLLECHDYMVHDHPSAETFLSQTIDGVDCLLVDHHLQGMTGLDLLERLRAAGDDTPALVITGCCNPTIIARAERIGVKILLKPVFDAYLISSIETTRRAKPDSGYPP